MSIDNQVPASFVTTFRTDIRKVATLVKWLHMNSNPPSSRSDALAKAVDTLVAMIEHSRPDLATTSYSAAVEILNHYGLVDPTKMRNISTLVKSLAGESLTLEQGSGDTLEEELLKAALLRQQANTNNLAELGQLPAEEPEAS